MNKFFKSISLFLSTLMVFLLTSESVSAKVNIPDGNQISTQKESFVIHNSDPNNTIYTYTENGKEYRVVESSNEDLTKVDSNIYVKNKKWKYELESKINSTIENNEVIVKTQSKGISKEKIEVFELDSLGEYIPDEILNDVPNETTSEITPFRIIEDNGLTSWYYAGTFKYSNIIAKATLSLVVAIITNVALPGLASAAGVALSATAKTAISNIAGQIVSYGVSVIYYSQVVHYKYLIGTDLPRAERTATSVYRDSSRTQKIGNTVVSEYYS